MHDHGGSDGSEESAQAANSSEQDGSGTSQFEVSLRAYDHVTVQAENEGEAIEKAKDRVKSNLSGWTIDGTEATEIDGVGL